MKDPLLGPRSVITITQGLDASIILQNYEQGQQPGSEQQGPHEPSATGKTLPQPPRHLLLTQTWPNGWLGAGDSDERARRSSVDSLSMESGHKPIISRWKQVGGGTAGPCGPAAGSEDT
eukprot:g53512.t1